MRIARKISLLFVGGMFFTLAALPALAQEKEFQQVRINRNPLRDLGLIVRDKLAKKEIDLEAPFSVESRITSGSIKYIKIEGDPRSTQLVKKSIEALSDSGFLEYFAKLGGKDVNLAIEQNSDFIIGKVEFEVETPARAMNIKNIFVMFITSKLHKKMASAKPADKDDLEILKTAAIEATGKKVSIRFAVPAATARELIRKILNDDSHFPDPAEK